MWAYYRWVRQQVAENTPWDEFVRELITARGSTLENGAANFFVLHQDPPELAETISQAFLGMSIGCAKCHNHPLEKWTNDQYYGMANLFSRAKSKNGSGRRECDRLYRRSRRAGAAAQGKPQPPRPLDAEAVPFESTADRREYLADWLTRPTTRTSPRAITNRIWANYLSVGLVEAVDDLRLTNPASNEELLNAAAKYLVENKYDTKALMRAILQSATYQRTSRSLPENEVDRRYYWRDITRDGLMAEVLLDAISQVTARADAVLSRKRRSAKPQHRRARRSLSEHDARVDATGFECVVVLPEIVRAAQRLLTCECERTDEPSMVQVLHLSNGDTINEKLAAKGNRIDQILTAGEPNEKIVEDAYLEHAVAVIRSADERGRLLAELSSAPAAERRQVLEDLYWSLLSSKEFLLNH